PLGKYLWALISGLSRGGVRRFQFVARGIRPGIRRGAIRGGCRWVWLVRSSLRTAIRRSGRFRLARRRVSWGTVFGIGVSSWLLVVWVLCFSIEDRGSLAVRPAWGWEGLQVRAFRDVLGFWRIL